MGNKYNVTIQSENNTLIHKIKLYKKIFGSAPWNEGFVCGNCHKNLPIDFYGRCECGEMNNFSNYYPNLDLKKSLQKLIDTNGYKEAIAYVGNNMVGFMWGWDDSLKSLNEHKFGLDKAEYIKLQHNIQSIYPDFDVDDFYYFSEIGVDSDFRGNDIAGKLYKHNLERIKKEGKKYIVVRTTRKTDLPYLWFKKMGYKDVYFLNDNLQRVILVGQIET